MIQSAVNYGRVLARALVTGLTTENQRFSSQLQQKASNPNVYLVSAVAGYSKSSLSLTAPSKWSYGEDAYFVSGCKNTCVVGEFLTLWLQMCR